MNYRNFNSNPNQNQMPSHFNAFGAADSFSSMRQTSPRRGEFGGQHPQLTQQWSRPFNSANSFNNTSQQFGMATTPMFNQNRCDYGSFQRASPSQFHQKQLQGSAFRQDQFNSGLLNAPQSGVRQFNSINLDGQQDYQREEMLNRSPERGAGFYQERPEQDFYSSQQQHDDSPEHSDAWRTRSRSRSRSRSHSRSRNHSRSRSPRHLSPSLSSRRQVSPWRCLSRESALYRGTPSSVAMRSPLPSRGNGSGEGGIWRPMVNLSKPENQELHQDEFRSQRKKRPQSDLPSLGEPGGKDDPNRKNLCGARTKWYLRYLKKGFHPDEAIRMAREPKQPAANYLPDDEKSESWELPNGEHVPNDEPSVPLKSTEKVEAEATELVVCLVPVGYPKEQLSHREKLDLEEAILQEVVIAGDSTPFPLSFSSISFNSGSLKLHCANPFSANWLINACVNLSSYKGRPVVAKSGDVLPPKTQYYYVTVFLPRSVDKSDEYVLGLIKSQNKHETDLWKLHTRKDQFNGTLLVLSIDQRSANEIAANDYTIFYRYGKVPVRGLRKRFGDKSPPRQPKPNVNRRLKTPKAPPTKAVKIERVKCGAMPKRTPVVQPAKSTYCIDLASDDND